MDHAGVALHLSLIFQSVNLRRYLLSYLQSVSQPADLFVALFLLIHHLVLFAHQVFLVALVLLVQFLILLAHLQHLQGKSTGVTQVEHSHDTSRTQVEHLCKTGRTVVKHRLSTGMAQVQYR